ncbi:MAG: hypothetical protein Kow0090_13540 [Myxococcota bacterium]
MLAKITIIIILYIIYVIFYSESKKKSEFYRPRRRSSYLRRHGVLDEETLKRDEKIGMARKGTGLPIMKIIMIIFALIALAITYHFEKNKGAQATLLEKYFGGRRVTTPPEENPPPIKLRTPNDEMD